MSTLTPAKTGKKTSDDEDPITPMREKFATDLRPNGRLPKLDSIAAAIQKLLETNRKLMKDCKGAIEHDGQKLTSSTLVTRRDFDIIKTRNGVDGSGKDFVVFEAYPWYGEKEFDITPLIQLPSELLSIFCTQTHKSGLIKYDALFETSSVLHDSIIVSYLVNLKNHLLSVESCLKGIHEWLTKPATSMSFVEQTFGAGAVKAAEFERKTNPFCINCGGKHKSHSRGSGRYGRSMDDLYCPGYDSRKFKRANSLEMKRVYTSTKINDSFDITDANQRARLTKLIEFVCHE